MSNNKPNKKKGAKRKNPRPSTRRTSSASGTTARQVRLTPVYREQPDTSLIALCYWLVATRIVEEAEKHGDLDCPDPEVHPEQGE